jgi:hypothetical protein
MWSYRDSALIETGDAVQLVSIDGRPPDGDGPVTLPAALLEELDDRLGGSEW